MLAQGEAAVSLSGIVNAGRVRIFGFEFFGGGRCVLEICIDIEFVIWIKNFF